LAVYLLAFQGCHSGRVSDDGSPGRGQIQEGYWPDFLQIEIETVLIVITVSVMACLA